jgi:hypothetical protein
MSYISYRFFDNSDIRNLIDMAFFSVFSYCAKQLWSRRNSIRINLKNTIPVLTIQTLSHSFVFFLLSAMFFGKLHLKYLENQFGKISVILFFSIVVLIAQKNTYLATRLSIICAKYFKQYS